MQPPENQSHEDETDLMKAGKDGQTGPYREEQMNHAAERLVVELVCKKKNATKKLSIYSKEAKNKQKSVQLYFQAGMSHWLKSDCSIQFSIYFSGNLMS